MSQYHLDDPINLDKVMYYTPIPVPHSLGTANDFFTNIKKAAMLHYLREDAPEETPLTKSLYIQDGNALSHALKNLPPTFSAICFQVLGQMVAEKNFVFSTDSYHADSIKALERLCCGLSQLYIIEGEGARKTVDFKLFLANEENML